MSIIYSNISMYIVLVLDRILPLRLAIHLHNRYVKIEIKIVPMVTVIVTIFLTSPFVSVNQKIVLH